MKNGKPVIGLTISYEKTKEQDRVFVNHSYLDAIRHFGGMPLILPTEGDLDELEALVELCAGILLTGGDDLDPKSPLAQVTGKNSIGVNSHHHQAIKDLASGFRVMGRCEDGIVEAIWAPNEKFRWGVQWHPERIWDIEASSAKIFEAFIAACK